MPSRVARPACRVIGAIFLALAIAGFMDGPIVGEHGFIVADTTMSALHGALGLFLLATSFAGESVCAFSLYASAGVCLVLGAFALYNLGSNDLVKLYDLPTLTRSAAYFQLVAAVVMAISGKMNTASKQLFRE